MAILHNPRTGFVVSGPALASIIDQHFCDVAVFSVAPYNILLERGDFMGAIEEVSSSTTQIGSVATLPVAAIQPPPGYHVQVQPEVLQISILEHTPQDRQEDLLQLLLQFMTVLKSSPKLTPRLPHDDRPVNKREPFYQKQGKIPQAHCSVIKETLDSWIRLGLIRKADSMFNTPLLCLQHPDSYRIVQDFQALNK